MDVSFSSNDIKILRDVIRHAEHAMVFHRLKNFMVSGRSFEDAIAAGVAIIERKYEQLESDADIFDKDIRRKSGLDDWNRECREINKGIRRRERS